MEDLNLLSEELLEQIFVYLNDIDWEEDQIDNILGQISQPKEIKSHTSVWDFLF